MAQTDFTLPICGKLRRKEQLFPATGGGGIGRDADGKTTITSYTTDNGFRHRNPDGPEAADTIDELCEALVGMLRVCPSEKGGMRLAEYDAARAALARARGEVTP